MSDSLPKKKNLISISEAAKYLGVSIDTIRRWDSSGVLHSERPDGKNRYFSMNELEKHKSQKPLSISEVAKKLNVSATTLRRLESRGLIKPSRNNAGERVFDTNQIDDFKNSDYFLRKKYTKLTLSESSKPELIDQESKKQESSKPEPSKNNVDLHGNNIEFSQETSAQNQNQNQNKEAVSYVPNFIAISVAVFVLLFMVGAGNVTLFETQKFQLIPTHAILEKITFSLFYPPSNLQSPKTGIITPTHQVKAPEAIPLVDFTKNGDMEEATPSGKRQLAETIKVVEIKISDGSTEVNVMKEPDNTSTKLNTAREGDFFEFISLEPGWIKVRPLEISDPEFLNQENSESVGFIPKKYAEVKVFEFASIESGWNEVKTGSESSKLKTEDQTKIKEEDVKNSN